MLSDHSTVAAGVGGRLRPGSAGCDLCYKDMFELCLRKPCPYEPHPLFFFEGALLLENAAVIVHCPEFGVCPLLSMHCVYGERSYNYTSPIICYTEDVSLLGVSIIKISTV